MFSDLRCFDYTSPGMELLLLIPSTYHFWDLVILKEVYGDSKLMRQTLFHHQIGLAGLLAALFFGRIVGPIVVSLLVAELSTVFLSIRSIQVMHKYDKDPAYATPYLINAFCLFFSFFLTRIVYYIVFAIAVVLRFAIETNYSVAIEELGLFKIIIIYSLSSIFFALMVLNFLWFGKMVKAIRKLMSVDKKDNKFQRTSGDEEGGE